MTGCLNLSSRAELIKLVGCYDVQTVQDGYLNRTQRVLYHNEIVSTHTEESLMSCRSTQEYNQKLLCSAKTAQNVVKKQLEDAHSQEYLDSKDSYLKEKPSDLLAQFEVSCFSSGFLQVWKQLVLPSLVYVGK